MGTAREVAERTYAAMQTGDIDGVMRQCSPECELHDLGMTFHGREQIGQYLQAFITAFPDIGIEVRRLLADDQSVAAEVRFTGKQTGPLAMPTGEIPASGRTIDIEAVDFLSIEDGLITTWRVYLDSMTFLRQLGLMPEPAQAATA